MTTKHTTIFFNYTMEVTRNGFKKFNYSLTNELEFEQNADGVSDATEFEVAPDYESIMEAAIIELDDWEPGDVTAKVIEHRYYDPFEFDDYEDGISYLESEERIIGMIER